MSFFEKKEGIYLLRVRLNPNSSCCKTGGTMLDEFGQEWLKIAVCSAPEKGKANKELIAFLAKSFDISKSCFSITFGQTDRYKKIEIRTNNNLDRVLEKFSDVCHNH